MNIKEEALKYIRGLSEKELVDFFYEATIDRRKFNKYDDGFDIETLCIVQSSFGSYKNDIEKESYSEFMALPSKELTEMNWVKKEADLTEQGKCKKLILCVAKEAICPICGTITECT